MIYTTIQGDTWDVIAFKLYGLESRMLQLMEYNPEHMHIVVFSAGIVLAVPELQEEAASDLPPWKRVTA